MRNDDFTITGFVSDEEKNRSKKFWRRTFLVYAGIEIIILGIQYIITRSKCDACVMPPAFYLVNWLQHLLFTGLLWFFLNRFYYTMTWKIIPVNVFAFLAYYFLWVSSLYAIFHSGQHWLLDKDFAAPPFQTLVYSSWFDIGKYVLKLTAFYALKFYFEYRKTERQRIQLAVINKDIQLNLLKQQLSPHFYFNTLNNLYGLARSNSTKLPGALHQLSSIMRYVIVDCNQPKVLLSQEINFLQSYISLEKLRYEQNTVIEMEVRGDAGNHTVLPLLLIQFVENAFKHGMKEKSDRNWMKVNLQVEKDELQFVVDNSYYETTVSQGIGINSVKHILNLQYEGKHDMRMEYKENRFLVTLKLKLS
jgi:sensor histidine kinase YesM